MPENEYSQSGNDADLNKRVYAGFFVRLAAYLVDLLIVSLGLLIPKITAFFLSIADVRGILVKHVIFRFSILDIIFYALTVLYFILMTYYNGATLGKMLFRLKVVSTEERTPTFFEIFLRETIGRFLSTVILYIGYLMAGPSEEKAALHDRLADTRVVYAHEYDTYRNQRRRKKQMQDAYEYDTYMNNPYMNYSEVHEPDNNYSGTYYGADISYRANNENRGPAPHFEHYSVGNENKHPESSSYPDTKSSLHSDGGHPGNSSYPDTKSSLYSDGEHQESGSSSDEDVS
ncbi:MAG: RDD family protein [Lachnospiraceae bacterium]|jgi:uncharacterized RDD family membrane protein YckC|nr:RDD family protein [Lachnospiraceae bacterium]MEE3460962.1 RDD family protein [Lachnospiraceae bacterium]